LIRRERGQPTQLAVKVPGVLLFFREDARIQNAPHVIRSIGFFFVQQGLQVGDSIAPTIRQGADGNQPPFAFPFSEPCDTHPEHLSRLADADTRFVPCVIT
jgi:hypothetical protein